MRNIHPLFHLFIAVSITLAAGCSSTQTCTDLRGTYQQTLNQQKSRTDTQRVLMATQIHEDTLGELIEQALERKGTLSYKGKRSLPGMAALELQITWTRLSFALTSECNNCIQITSGLNIRAKMTSAGVSLGTQNAKGQLVGVLPLEIRSDGNGSQLATDLRKMTLKTLKIKLPGLPNAITKSAEPLARDIVHNMLGKFGDTITLTRWKPMKLPGGSIQVRAQQLAVFAPERTLWVGWSSALPAGVDIPSLKPRASLQPGDAAAIAFAGPAMTALMQAMQAGGAIPSRLNQELKPDKSGDVFITLNQVSPTSDGLKTLFTAWNLPQTGACYRIDMEADAKFSIVPPKPAAARLKERQGDFTVKLDNMRVLQSSGDDTAVRLGLWLRSIFVEETMEAQTRMLAAHELDVAGGKFNVAFQRAETHEDAVTFYMKPSWKPN